MKSPVLARILRAVPVSSGVAHYVAVTERGRKQTIYLRSEAILKEGDHVRVQEGRSGEWTMT